MQLCQISNLNGTVFYLAAKILLHFTFAVLRAVTYNNKQIQLFAKLQHIIVYQGKPVGLQTIMFILLSLLLYFYQLYDTCHL